MRRSLSLTGGAGGNTRVAFAMKKTRNISNLLSSLAKQEDAFLRVRFLAPVAGEGHVQVRIAGVICRLQIRPRRFAGWGVFAPSSYTEAVLDRVATMAERQAYLRLWPAARLIVIDARRAVPAQLGDARFAIDGDVIVHDVADADLFDTVVARFDGARFWFEQADPQADPIAAAYLREAILAMRDPRRLTLQGLTPEQRMAYAYLHADRLRAEAERARAKEAAARLTHEGRLKTALEHAGATLTGFSDVHDVYRVSYIVDRRQYTSIVRKDNLRVHSAGICLSGEDGKFDLTSLVSVLREGHKHGTRHGTQV